ncbi:MAG: sigma-70 family RNA polymerase sigma factor [Marinilabiliaceae bacterium]|nr:sigma-70 family RNA polymerase sigma factor [Marinilabiliaceae bacterium]
MKTTEKTKKPDKVAPIELKLTKKSFEQIYNKYFTSLCKFANKIVENKEVSENIIQECFYILWEKRKTIKIKTSLKAYILQSIHNQCLKFIKHNEVMRKHNEHIQRENESNFQKLNENNPLHILIKTETECEVKKAIDDLPAQCREILILWDEELSYEEIAAKLNLAIGTVRTQLTRAKDKLRNQLKNK